jgi:uncharacterized coiled-coil protein SlyX
MATKLRRSCMRCKILSALFCTTTLTILGCSGSTPSGGGLATQQVIHDRTVTGNCQTNQTAYPLPGRPAVCLSSDYALFLACLAEAGLSKASTDKAADDSIKLGATVPTAGVGINAGAEEKTASGLVAEYEKGDTLEKKEKANAVRSCNDDFRAARKLPPLPTANDIFDTLKPPATRFADPPKDAIKEAYDRSSVAVDCRGFETRAYGIQGYAAAASCYYWWAQQSSDKWDDVVRLWSKASTICEKDSPCERRTQMNRDAAAEIVKARDALKAALAEDSEDKDKLAGYKQALQEANDSLTKTENAIENLAEKLKISTENKLSEEVIKDITDRIASLNDERKRLKTVVAEQDKLLKGLRTEIAELKKQVENARKEAMEWKRKYYFVLTGESAS